MTSSYSIKSLSEEGKSRYLHKLQLCSLSSCPYQLPADSWSNDPTQWPDIEWPDIYNYLISSPGVYTREAMKNRKSLEGHNQFTSGWVRTVLHFRPKPKVPVIIMKADVMPSQRFSENAHTPWIAIDSDTTQIITAHCSCMAGLGESCSHIGALLFKIEAAIRMGYNKIACTDEACKWNNDFVKKIKGTRISEVKFYTPKSVNGLKRKGPTLMSKTHSAQTEEEKTEILNKFSKLASKPVVLHSFSDHCNSFTPIYTPPARAKLPCNLRCLFSDSNINSDLVQLSKETLDNMKISSEASSYIYNLTKKQSKSQLWHDIRCGRITASCIHDILHTDIDNPSSSLIKNICANGRVSSTSVPALQWGLEHEKLALAEFQTYASADHTDFQIEESGLLLSTKHPFMGASADGIFHCRCHNEKFVIEIKCPYSVRDTVSLEDAIFSYKDFFISNQKSLKTTHRYYTQVQAQLFIYDLEICNFIVWTPNWTFITQISADPTFANSIVNTSQQFYLRHILPELLTRKLETQEITSRQPEPHTITAPVLYCFCNSEDDDNKTWIQCDAIDCTKKRFHLDCVNIKRVPKRKWYCPMCRKNDKYKKLASKK